MTFSPKLKKSLYGTGFVAAVLLIIGCGILAVFGLVTHRANSLTWINLVLLTAIFVFCAVVMLRAFRALD